MVQIILLSIITISVVFLPDYHSDISSLKRTLYSILEELREIKNNLETIKREVEDDKR